MSLFPNFMLSWFNAVVWPTTSQSSNMCMGWQKTWTMDGSITFWRFIVLRKWTKIFCFKYEFLHKEIQTINKKIKGFAVGKIFNLDKEVKKLKQMADYPGGNKNWIIPSDKTHRDVQVNSVLVHSVLDFARPFHDGSKLLFRRIDSKKYKRIPVHEPKLAPYKSGFLLFSFIFSIFFTFLNQIQ